MVRAGKVTYFLLWLLKALFMHQFMFRIMDEWSKLVYNVEKSNDSVSVAFWCLFITSIESMMSWYLLQYHICFMPVREYSRSQYHLCCDSTALRI